MDRRYPAVSIVASSNCCDAVRELQENIFLAAEAPQLPLPGCNMPDGCNCRYRKYPDRRQGNEDRRMFGETRRSVMYAGDEKRHEGKGRRSED